MRRRGRERISETEKVRNKLGRDVSRFLVTAVPHHRARAGPPRETGSPRIADRGIFLLVRGDLNDRFRCIIVRKGTFSRFGDKKIS